MNSAELRALVDLALTDAVWSAEYDSNAELGSAARMLSADLERRLAEQRAEIERLTHRLGCIADFDAETVTLAVAKAEAEAQANKRDAERYRFHRHHDQGIDVAMNGELLNRTGEELDEITDQLIARVAALARKEGGGK